MTLLLVNSAPLIRTQISKKATHIIHTAWELNFKLRVEGFERTHILGVRHLIDLALSSGSKKHLIFISSIAVVAGNKLTTGAPEGPAEDDSHALMGYGQAKLVGERIIERAAENCGLRAIIIRIGQIS